MSISEALQQKAQTKTKASFTNNALVGIFSSQPVVEKRKIENLPLIIPKRAKSAKVVPDDDDDAEDGFDEEEKEQWAEQSDQEDEYEEGEEGEEQEEEDEDDEEGGEGKRKKKKESSVGKKEKKKEKGKEKEKDPEQEKKEKEAAEQKERDKRTIFVGNVEVNTKKKELITLFSKYGTVESVRFRSIAFTTPSLSRKISYKIQAFHPERKTCNAYVVFEKVEQAVAALKENGILFHTFHLRVDLASGAEGVAKHNKNTVFVGNLPLDIHEEEIREYFAFCGEIENVRVVRDPTTNLGKGIGYVTFQERDSVVAALGLHESKLKGRSIRVFPAQKQKQPHKPTHKSEQNESSFQSNNPNKSNAMRRLKGKGQSVGFEGQRSEEGVKPRLKIHSNKSKNDHNIKKKKPNKSPKNKTNNNNNKPKKGKKSVSYTHLTLPTICSV
eukprot:TRINITY_DN3748_c1_g1_i1.p1 TRINITY_DN3748_c1_g1~~TRINITY_DN3748_c1_g1_i1.p1  ORF type:complete len:454 (+),score=158.77 TRINITY_DN3748_c1_g1_i1:41-1363(+)